MAYRDDILALSPAHLYIFDGDYVDTVAANNGINSGFAASTSITEDATSSVRCSVKSQRVTIPDSTPINGALTGKGVGGWVRLNSVQLPPKSIYGEGTTTQQFRFVMWAGNTLMLDIVDGTDIYQAYSDRVLQPNRTYHIFGLVKTSGEFELYVDGVLQSITNPSPALYSNRNVDSGTPCEYGDPAGTTEVGNATVLLNGAEACDYAYWAHFANADVPTGTQIREELFEKGAVPEVTITNQAGLDALANTVRPDVPLCIRVDVAGDLTLVADNITFDPLSSIHVQYSGTGTLTWINTNGSNASIGSAPNGTINLVNPATLTVTDLVAGSEIRFFEAGTTNEIAGIESSGTSFGTSTQVSAVDIRIMKQGYQYKVVRNIDMTQGNVSVVAGQVVDRQFRN